MQVRSLLILGALVYRKRLPDSRQKCELIDDSIEPHTGCPPINGPESEPREFHRPVIQLEHVLFCRQFRLTVWRLGIAIKLLRDLLFGATGTAVVGTIADVTDWGVAFGLLAGLFLAVGLVALANGTGEFSSDRA
jgi:hypothetical protein